jgi:hypothetical protein
MAGIFWVIAPRWSPGMMRFMFSWSSGEQR